MKCCRQTKGCFSVRNWSLFCFLLGAMLITAAIVLPPVINKLVNEKVCDKVCIPRSSDDATTRGNWLTNTNRDMNPLETYSFYVYNITNAEEMLNGTYPIVTMHGPYVYDLYREKFNVSYNADESEVAYESREMYTFNRDRSAPGVSEDDLITSVNVPTVASWYLIQQSTLPEDVKMTSLKFISGACKTYKEYDKQSCLFATRTAHDVIFKQDSFLITLANNMYFIGSDVALTQLHPILNGSTNADWAHQQRWAHNYGLGGEYIPRQLKFSNQNIDLRVVGAVPTDARDVRTKQLTGHGNLKDVSQTTMYVGNTTLHMWEQPVQVTGRDSYQVQPFLDDSDLISIFDPQIMRSVNFQYDRKVSLLDVEMNRYYPNNLLNGHDQTYYGPNITGLFNASMIATIRYGVPTPIYVSRPYLAGVNSTWTKNITCKNCPNVHMMDRDDLEIYVDIEPTIGKVLRGRKRAQTNILIGDPTIFGNRSQFHEDSYRWANVSETLVPVVWFEYGAEMDQHQADMVKDGLSQIHIAHIATKAALYGGAGAGSLIFVFAIVLLIHYRRLRALESMEVYEREPMMNGAGPGDGVYTSRTPYYQG